MKNEKQIAILDCYMVYLNVLVYFVNIEVVLKTCSNIKNIFHFSNPFLFFIFLYINIRKHINFI
jgi:uncharacterized protein YebE (UPF0316 family)